MKLATYELRLTIGKTLFSQRVRYDTEDRFQEERKERVRKEFAIFVIPYLIKEGIVKELDLTDEEQARRIKEHENETDTQNPQ